jgi:hypothetical protein
MIYKVIVSLLLTFMILISPYYLSNNLNGQSNLCNKCTHLQSELTKTKDTYQKIQRLIAKASLNYANNEKLLTSTPLPDAPLKSKIQSINSQLSQLIPQAKDATSPVIMQKIKLLESKLSQCIKDFCKNNNSLSSSSVNAGDELTDLDILKYEFATKMNDIRFCGMTDIIDNIRAGPATMKFYDSYCDKIRYR